MMKSFKIAFILVIACLLLASVASAAVIDGDIQEGGSWGQAFTWDYRPQGANVLNLWTTGPGFEQATGLPAGWNYYQSADDIFVQISKNTGAGPNYVWTQWWNDPRQDIHLDWQEVAYNFTTGETTQYWYGGIDYHSGNGWYNGTYGGPSGPVGPVPIPAAVYLLGTGLVGIVGWRKRFPSQQ